MGYGSQGATAPTESPNLIASEISARATSPATLPVSVLSVVVTVLLAHYARVRGFGLYEDDYWAVAPYLAQRPAALWPVLVDCFKTWPQGRPLNHLLPPALAVAGSQLGGLRGAYVIAAGWLAANGTLVLLVARRVLSPRGALVTAVAYVLFPADSTKILLVHAAHVQGAMTFLLLGTWLWLRGGAARVASYPLAGLALLAYESAFLPFLAVPLLAPANRQRTLPRWTWHAVGCALLVGSVLAVRILLGEDRVAAAAAQRGETLWRVVTSFAIGPWTSGGVLLRSLVTAWRDADRVGAMTAVLFGVALVVALSAVGRTPLRSSLPALAEPARLAQPDGGAMPWWRVLLFGLLSWSLSYALTLVNYPPTQTVGRLTSTHVAGAFGVALSIGALDDGLRRRLRFSFLGTVGVAIVFCSWLLYQQGIQRQFVEAWAAQRSYWHAVLSLAREVRAGWTVIVEGHPVDGPPAILVNSWADPLAYRELLPADWRPPVAYAHLGRVGEFVSFREHGGTVEWKPEFWGGPFRPIDPTRLVLLHDDGGVLTRVQAIRTPLGTLRSAAPVSPPGPGLRGSGPVSRLMFDP